MKLIDVSGVRTVSIIIALMMETVRTSEMSINFNVITRCYIPEDSKPQLLNYHPQGRRRHGRPLKSREC
jgi:hypothetical protein